MEVSNPVWQIMFTVSLKTPNLDSRVLRPIKGLSGNDMKVPYYALRGMLRSLVIPAKTFKGS